MTDNALGDVVTSGDGINDISSIVQSLRKEGKMTHPLFPIYMTTPEESR